MYGGVGDLGRARNRALPGVEAHMTVERLLEVAKEWPDWEEWSGLLYLEATEQLPTLADERAVRRWVAGVRAKYKNEQRFGGGDRRWRRLAR